MIDNIDDFVNFLKLAAEEMPLNMDNKEYRMVPDIQGFYKIEIWLDGLFVGKSKESYESLFAAAAAIERPAATGSSFTFEEGC